MSTLAYLHIATEKVKGPACVLTFLGIELGMLNMQLSLFHTTLLAVPHQSSKALSSCQVMAKSEALQQEGAAVADREVAACL